MTFPSQWNVYVKAAPLPGHPTKLHKTTQHIEQMEATLARHRENKKTLMLEWVMITLHFLFFSTQFYIYIHAHTRIY